MTENIGNIYGGVFETLLPTYAEFLKKQYGYWPHKCKALASIYLALNTNQLIAQREFSTSEARSLIAPALKTFTTSLLFATSEEQSRTKFKLVNTASDALKFAFQACFLPTYSSVEWLPKGTSIPSSIRLEYVAKKHSESITFLY
jgi:hypothetical protein